MWFGCFNGSLIRFANKLNQMLLLFFVCLFSCCCFFFFFFFFFFFLLLLLLWGGVWSQRSHGETLCSREGHYVFFLLHRLGLQGVSDIFVYIGLADFLGVKIFNFNILGGLGTLKMTFF